MKKLISLIMLACSVSYAGQLDYSTDQVNQAVGDVINQYGAYAYMIDPSSTTCTVAETWYDVVRLKIQADKIQTVNVLGFQTWATRF